MRLLLVPVVSSLALVACEPPQELVHIDSRSLPEASDDSGEDVVDDEVFVDASALRLAEAGSSARLAGGELTFSEDGVAFASWVASDNGNGDVWLARSVDGGGTWEQPVPVETGSSPAVAGGERRPFVAVSEDRVAVIWTSNPDPATWVAIAERTDGPLSFGAPMAVGTGDETDLEDFGNGVFLSDGTLVVVTHVTVWGGSPEEALFISRERDGWVPSSITDDAPGEPCACCAIDLLATDDGGLLVAYRNNIDDVRDQFVLAVTADREVSWSQASFTNWVIQGCPMQGPRFLPLPSGELLMFWSDPTAGDNRIWMARSDDDGATWQDESLVTPGNWVEGGQRWPRAAVDANGHIHIAFHVGSDVWTAWSNDSGASFAEPAMVQTSDGVLQEAELAIGPQGAAMVGSSGEYPDLSVWFTPIE